MKSPILTYLISTYGLTGWPFFGVSHIENKFGDCSEEIDQLIKSGWIRKREGASANLIELIKFE